MLAIDSLGIPWPLAYRGAVKGVLFAGAFHDVLQDTDDIRDPALAAIRGVLARQCRDPRSSITVAARTRGGGPVGSADGEGRSPLGSTLVPCRSGTRRSTH
jgi:hypothetical protein